MNDSANRDPTTAMSDGRNDAEQTEEFFSTKFQTSSSNLFSLLVSFARQPQ